MVGAYKTHMAEMTAFSAVELDNYLRNTNGSLRNVGDFAKALRDYDSKYDLSLWMAMGSPNIKLEEIAVQIDLLKMELSDVENLPRDRVENLRDFCVIASRQFLSDVPTRTRLLP